MSKDIDGRSKKHLVSLGMLFIILIFALLLRLVQFTGLICCDHWDYVYLAFDAANGSVGISPGDIRGVTPRLALYLPIGFFYWQLGPSEFSTLVYPLLTSLAGIAFMYGICRLLAGEAAGLIAAAIWAMFPLEVFLSTSVAPDSILASYSIGAVFFMVLGHSRKGLSSLFAYSVGVVFGLLAVLVKPLAAVTLLFIFLFLFVKLLESNREWLKSFYFRNKSSVRIVLGISAILVSAYLLIFYVPGQSRSFLELLNRTATDLVAKLILGQTKEDFPIFGTIFETDLFFTSAPLFLLAIFGAYSRATNGTWILLLWFLAQFAYYEWGSVATNPFVTYAPMTAFRGDRNVLFVLAPLCALAGVYLSKSISARHARGFMIISWLVALPVAVWLKHSNWEGASATLVGIMATLSVVGIFGIPTMQGQMRGQTREYVTGIFLVTFLGALLRPTLPYHTSYPYWQYQQTYTEGIREAAEFFVKNTRLPILALSRDNAQELNFLSRFQLGHKDLLLRHEVHDARIRVVENPLDWKESALLYLRDEVNTFQPIPNHWWKMAEFESATDRPITIFRILSTEDAERELDEAKRALEDGYGFNELERLLAAGINSQDPEAIIRAWSELAHLYAGVYPLRVVSPSLIAAVERDPSVRSPNMLTSNLAGGSASLQTDSVTSDMYRLEIEDGTLQYELRENPSSEVGVFEMVHLEPGTAYLFQIDIRTALPVDLLRVPAIEAGDSHNYHSSYPEWTSVSAVFVTPKWEGPRTVRLDYFTLNQAGSIEARNPRLSELNFGTN